jgi:hypothetical protein
MSYDVDFVTKAVDAVTNRGEKTMQAVADELDVSIATLNLWVKKASAPKVAKKTAPAKTRVRKPKVVAANTGLDLNSLPQNVRTFIGNLLLENFELRSKVQ